VLDINCFDSKQRFIEALREAYGGGTFLLGPQVTGAIVQLFVSSLKDDLRQQEPKKYFHEAKFMGYHGNNYWLVSNDVSI
jgi:hypothetical protein